MAGQPNKAATATGGSAFVGWLPVTQAATMPVAEVLARLGSSTRGLDEAEVARRRSMVGSNAVRTHRVSAVEVLVRQFRSALLSLLLIAATVSFFVGERTNALVIGVILALSVGFGFLNEYRAEMAGAALHERIRHTAVVYRSGQVRQVDVTDLVPGDVVRVEFGTVIPADLRLVEANGLACEEAVLTGEPASVAKTTAPVPAGAALAESSSCALMGTVVRSGSGLGVVVATGPHSEFGRVAVGLGRHHPPTEFQTGLTRFSFLLARVAAVLTTVIFAINLVLHRPLIDAVLFSLAIAVGITPQLLPAIVTTSLAAGSRRLAAKRVLVKRLICTEDLGNVQVLFTDKTGTLTAGQVALQEALGPDGRPDNRPLLLGLLANEAVRLASGEVVGGNPLDQALWQAAPADGLPYARYRKVALVPFDHVRRRTSAIVDGPDGRLLVVKGAPELVMSLCRTTPPQASAALTERLSAGARVIAVASRAAPDLTTLTADDEKDLEFAGLLVLSDPPKSDVQAALNQLAALGISVKVLTGDHPAVAVRVCQRVGLPVTGVVTGADLARIDDAALPAAIASTTVFARLTPEDKARLVRAQRSTGTDVAFLGDGVNDALALHTADVGVSVDTGTDVAKDAADVLLLDKDLGVLARGVAEGRRIFANTVKYVLMATSSNFGNMFSAAAASAFLPFLPLLPSQILLNNLIYDATQLAIPTDHVDTEQLTRPAHWDLREIRRFMLTFGPVSSVFDFLTFALLLEVLHAGPAEFRTGWFVESIATQALIVFVIRTHASPFWRSRPSTPLVAAVAVGVGVAWLLPYLPNAGLLGFTPLRAVFLVVVAGLIVAYLALVDTTKRALLSAADLERATPARVRATRVRHEHRRAARFTIRRV